MGKGGVLTTTTTTTSSESNRIESLMDFKSREDIMAADVRAITVLLVVHSAGAKM